jgi:PAS domain S-box-containing protein
MKDEFDLFAHVLKENISLKERIMLLENTFARRHKNIFKAGNTTGYQILYNMLRLMCDNVPDLIWAKDLDKNFIFANRAMCDILLKAANSDEPIGQTEVFFAEREREACPEDSNWYTFGSMSDYSDSKVMNDKATERFEEYGTVRGELLYLDIYKAPLFNENGIVIGIVGCARDITKEKQLEKENQVTIDALRKSQERYRFLLKATPDILFRISKKGKFLDFNADNSFEHNFPNEKIIGTHLKDIYTFDLAERISESILICLGTGLSQVLEYEMDIDDEIRYFELRIIKASEDEVLAIVRDETDKKLTELALKESDKKYRDLVDNSLLGIYINQNNLIRFCNAKFANIFGYRDPNDLIGMDFKELVNTRDWDRVNESIQMCEKGNSPKVQCRFNYKRKDGKEIIVEILGGRVIYYGNLAIQGSIIDITERTNAENEIVNAKEKAEEMNRLKTSFLANMSHELRTPLIGVMGFAELLSMDLTDPEMKNRSNMIFESGSRLLATLNQILELSAIEANTWTMDFESVNICESIKTTAEKFSDPVKKKNLYLELIAEEQEITANLDPKIFDQILTNLLNNAIKYTSSGGICINISKENINENEYAGIAITDTGIGISPESLDLIFDPFRQASEGYRRRYEGAGLGLTLAKRLIESMNGIITVESKEGIGSTFKIYFPLVKIKEIESGVVSNQEMLSGEYSTEEVKIKGHNILFVEDDEINRSVVKLFLKDACTLDLTSSGENSIEMAKQKKYSAILMDLKLAGKMSGLDAAKEIRKLNGYNDVPIVAVTAFTFLGGREGMLKEGCTHYLPKPFSREKLLKLVEEILV